MLYCFMVNNDKDICQYALIAGTVRSIFNLGCLFMGLESSDTEGCFMPWITVKLPSPLLQLCDSLTARVLALSCRPRIRFGSGV